MTVNTQKKNTSLFLGFLLLAGITNLLARTGIPELDSLLTLINYMIYAGLLLFWIESVRVRLLPDRARTYILGAAFLMLFYMLLRIFKYRMAADNIVLRYTVYAYWIPQMLIPALFLMTCIRIRRGRQEEKKRSETVLLIPAVILSLLVMTNDLHILIYVPKVDLNQFIVSGGTYTYGPMLYVLYAWMALATLTGLILLFRETGRRSPKVIFILLGEIFLWFGMILVNILILDKLSRAIGLFKQSPRIFNVPEIHIFGMLGVFEICIRYRLIPYNENYAGVFQKLQIPAAITDKDFKIVYHSDIEFPASQADLEKAMIIPAPLTPDLKLYGKELQAGYAFWVEDESDIHRAQEKLEEANEVIEEENDLIQAETEHKKKDAYLQSRHRIYHEIAEKLYPCQKRIGQLLDAVKPGAADYKELIARVSVLNAYVKRKTNLLLLSAENEVLNTRELFLALQESASYFTLAGLQTTILESEERQDYAEKLMALYDAFESLAEQLVGKAPSLMVSGKDDGLRLAAETDHLPDTDGILLPVQMNQSENILYMDILGRKER